MLHRTSHTTFFALPVVLALAAPAFALGDWYVAPNPNGPGTGTPQDPYATIQSAIDAPSTLAADTIHVASGHVYAENVNFNGKRLALTAWPLVGWNDLPVIDGGANGSCVGLSSGEFGASIVGFRLRNGRASRGGGLLALNCSLTVVGCVFEDNEALDFGGGLCAGFQSNVVVSGCVFVGNRATGALGYGGGAYLHLAQLVLDRCTFWGNSAYAGGGAALSGPHSIRNSIFWASGGGDFFTNASSVSITYSNTQSGVPGLGNISAEPVFWNPWGRNFRLNFGSPCIDAGNPASDPDADGSHADMGAIAFEPIDANDLVRAVNGGDSFCASTASVPGTVGPCPCGNVGAPGHGCAHSASTFGAMLTAAPATSAGEVVLHGYGMPATSTCIYFKGDQRATPGVTFGDGVRCVDGALIRIGMKTNVAGGSQYPSNAIEDPLSVRSQTPLGSGLVAHYQVYFRNSAAFCTPDTFNATNGYSVTW
ncbi:MAG: hypothetical protein IPJ77_14140 [Planctomycetes bacterium]|nr:hypothetical protein [Planctomycetota bacterium]